MTNIWSFGQSFNPCPLKLTGVTTTCNTNGEATFTIDNYEPVDANYYTWNVVELATSNGTPWTATGVQSITYSFGNLHISTYIVKVTYTNPVRNITCVDSIVVFPCCDTLATIITDPDQLPGVSTGNIANQNFIFAGTINLTQTLSFSNCNVVCAPGTSIRVSAGNGIVLDHTNLYSCYQMWQGLIMDNNSSIKMIGHSTIQDAARAIDVIEDVEGYITDGAVFDRNRVCFYAGPQNNHSLNFTDFCDFTMTGSGVLKPAYYGMPQVTRTAFLCENFSNLLLGNNGVYPFGPIIIQNISRGFELNNCNLSLEGARFSNVTQGVKATRQFPTAPGNFICNISNNEFFNCATGVWLREFTGSKVNPVTVINNLFNASATGNFVNARAIRITNSNPIPSYIQIHNDSINYYNSPIFLANATANAMLDVSLVNNGIYMNQGAAQFNTLRNGIKISNCAQVAVINNRIVRSSLLGLATQTPNFYGLNIELSPDGIVSDNTFMRCGTAVFYRGSNVGTQNSCNNLIAFDRGFHLDAATINNQGSPSTPQDNKWNNSRGRPFKISGTGPAQSPLPVWYYRAGVSFDVTPSDQSYVIPILLTNQPSAPTCGEVIDDPGDIDNPDFVDDSLNVEIIEDSLEFIMATENNRQITRHQLYRMLQSDTTILAENADLEYFYSNYSNVNIQLFDSYYAALGIGDLVSARQILNTIQATGEYQNDLYTVSDLYLKTRENLDYVFTESDVLALENIAYKSIFRCGDAVISARLLLGVEIEDALPVSQRIGKVSSISDSGISMVRSFNVYYFYGYDGLPVERIEVYNLTGQLLDAKLGGEINADLLPVGSLVKVISGQNVKVYRGL